VNPDNWPTVLILGKYMPRIKHFSDNIKTQYCKDCHVTKNSLHILGCPSELSSCGVHKFFIDCNCDLYPGVPV